MEFGTILMVCTFVLMAMRFIQKVTKDAVFDVAASIISMVAFIVILTFSLMSLPTTETAWAIMFGMWALNVIIGDNRGDDE